MAKRPRLTDKVLGALIEATGFRLAGDLDADMSEDKQDALATGDEWLRWLRATRETRKSARKAKE